MKAFFLSPEEVLRILAKVCPNRHSSVEVDVSYYDHYPEGHANQIQRSFKVYVAGVCSETSPDPGKATGAAFAAVAKSLGLDAPEQVFEVVEAMEKRPALGEALHAVRFPDLPEPREVAEADGFPDGHFGAASDEWAAGWLAGYDSSSYEEAFGEHYAARLTYDRQQEHAEGMKQGEKDRDDHFREPRVEQDPVDTLDTAIDADEVQPMKPEAAEGEGVAGIPDAEEVASE